MEAHYDFIIIGSGMGGLTSGAILAKNGFSVLVLEKNHQIGGALQVFSRDKCVFDTGVHYLGGLDKGENLYTIFNYLGVYNDLKLHRLDNDAFDIVRLQDGRTFKHGQGYDGFKKQLLEHFPEEEESIDLFLAKMKDVCSFFPLYNIEKETDQAYFESPEMLQLGAWDFVNSITKNKDLVKVLLGSGPLYAGDAKATPFYVVALILNSFIKGSYRLKDGGSQLAKSLVKRIREQGGQVIKHKEVIEGIWEEGVLKGVKCSDDTTYFANQFISNLHPQLTIEIFGKENFRPAYKNRIAKLKNTVSSFMVYISLKQDYFPYINSNYYEYFTDDIWNTVDYDQENWPQAMFVCTPLSSKSDDFAESLAIMCYMSHEEVQEWEHTFNTIANKSERGEAYLNFKKEKEQKVVERILKRFPKLEGGIVNVYSSTPLTYKDYIGTPEGALYGIEKNFNDPIKTTINPKTRIPNLYMTGQNIIFHGILGAAIGAFVTCFNFIDNEQTINELKKHE